MDELNDQVAAIEAKLAKAEAWFQEIDHTDQRFEKGFDRYVELLRERARLYLEECKPAVQKLF